MATGDVVTVELDLELPGALPLLLERTHVSSYRAGRLFGASWAATVDQRLAIDDDGVCYFAPDGMILVYPTPTAEQPVLPAAGPRWPLAVDPSGGHTLTAGDRTLHFGTRTGVRAQIVELDAISGPGGQRIDVERDQQGIPTVLRHSAGYLVALHTEHGRITELHVLGTDVDVLVLRYGYDERGRLVELVNSTGRPTQYQYDEAGRLTGWQDRNGTWYRYVYDTEGRCVRTVGTEGFYDGAFDYDQDRRTTIYTDSLGHVSRYEFNAAHHTVRETDPLGNTTVYQRDRQGRATSRTDPLGRTIHFEFGADGELVTVVRPDGSRVAVDTRAGLSIAAQVDGQVWRRTYEVGTEPDPLTEPIGVSTSTAALSSLAVSAADDDHQAGGDPGNDDERDVFGRPVAVVDATGRRTRLGWTIEGKLAWRATPAAREQWRYDGEGNEIEQVGPLGQVTRHTYGPFGLRTATVDATGARTTYGYDTELRLASVTNPHGETWWYTYDPVGRLIESVDFDGRTQRFDYDTAGQLVRSVNAAGQAVDYSYDAIGNLVELRTDAGSSTYAYDPVGRLVAATGPGSELTIERDARGRVVTHTVDGHTTEFHYDDETRSLRRRTPSGVDSEWTYDERGKPIGLTMSGHTLSFEYDQSGRERTRRVDEKVVVHNTIDADSRSAVQTVTLAEPTGDDGAWPGPLAWYQRRDYRADNHVIGIQNGTAGYASFQLDPNGRVTDVTAPDRREQYGYDALGNLTSAAGIAYGYEGTTLVTAGDWYYRYDAQGRLVRRSRDSETWHYTWDVLDRLTGVITPDGTRWRYRYDPLGRRIAKQRLDNAGAVAEQVEFAWDGAILVEQRHDDGVNAWVTTWEHHPEDDRPLAQLEGAAQSGFHTIVTDPLGTPVELFDTNGSPAGHAGTTVWGTPLTGVARTPLRFPGQYHDAETGLHYNVYRYYDPDT
ncbi:MAG TPA: DUF6531 domain-containing protein, partial [Pseudonocardiaceae bacterium]|nr:DUF6531 domain-containing protein [Pseudonocardiaceae bacterium]